MAAEHSARPTGCTAGEIDIYNMNYLAATWHAKCRGELYDCTSRNVGGVIFTDCERQAPVVAPVRRAPPLVVRTSDPGTGAPGVSAYFAFDRRASLVVQGTPAVSLGTLQFELVPWKRSR